MYMVCIRVRKTILTCTVTGIGCPARNGLAWSVVTWRRPVTIHADDQQNPFTDCTLCRVKKIEEVEMDHRQEQGWIGIQASMPKVWIFLSYKVVYRSTDWRLYVTSLGNTLWYATYHTHLYMWIIMRLASAIGVDRSPVWRNRNRWMAAMRIILSWMYSKIH